MHAGYRYPWQRGVSVSGRFAKGLGGPLSMSPFSKSSAFFNYHTSTGMIMHCQYGNCPGLVVTPRYPGFKNPDPSPSRMNLLELAISSPKCLTCCPDHKLLWAGSLYDPSHGQVG